jgi:hypothetical protein
MLMWLRVRLGYPLKRWGGVGKTELTSHGKSGTSQHDWNQRKPLIHCHSRYDAWSISSREVTQ